MEDQSTARSHSSDDAEGREYRGGKLVPITTDDFADRIIEDFVIPPLSSPTDNNNNSNYHQYHSSSEPSSRQESRGTAKNGNNNNISTNNNSNNPNAELSVEEMVANFQEEFLRFMRGLIDSQSENNRLQRTLTRMKRDALNGSLRLQVAMIMAEEDDKLVRSLKKEIKESKKNSSIAAAQVAESEAILIGLRKEVGVLKKAIKEANMPGRATTAASNGNSVRMPSATSSNLFESTSRIFRNADMEVELMMSRPEKLAILPQTGGNTGQLTEFQQWQVQNFKYSKHTPAASEYHDVDGLNVVDFLRTITKRTNRGDINFDELFATTNAELNALLGRKATGSITSVCSDESLDELSSAMTSLDSRSPTADPVNKNIRRLTASRLGKLKPHLLSSYQRRLNGTEPTTEDDVDSVNSDLSGKPSSALAGTSRPTTSTNVNTASMARTQSAAAVGGNSFASPIQRRTASRAVSRSGATSADIVGATGGNSGGVTFSDGTKPKDSVRSIAAAK